MTLDARHEWNKLMSFVQERINNDDCPHTDDILLLKTNEYIKELELRLAMYYNGLEVIKTKLYTEDEARLLVVHLIDKEMEKENG
jgi:hypothetical protein